MSEEAKILTAREIVQIVDKRAKDAEVKKMGFPSFFLEALEDSINKLVAQSRREVLEEVIEITEKTLAKKDDADHSWEYARETLLNDFKELKTEVTDERC